MQTQRQTQPAMIIRGEGKRERGEEGGDWKQEEKRREGVILVVFE